MITKQDIKTMDNETFFKVYTEMTEENKERLWKAQNKAWDEVKRAMLNYIQKFGPINVTETYGSGYITLGDDICFTDDGPGSISDCEEDFHEYH